MREIKVTWGETEYAITENMAFEMADAIEDHVTVFELSDMLRDMKKVRLNKLARAYAAMLNELGAKTTARDVKASLVAGLKAGDGEWVGVVTALIAILFDGVPETEGEPEGNVEAPAL